MEPSTQTDFRASVLGPFKRASLGILVFLVAVTVWSTTAKLATTVHLSGTLVSSIPNYEVQHPYGGKIASVLVKQHDRIAQDEPIFKLDTYVQKSSLAEIELQKKYLETEINVIDLLLAQDLKFSGANNDLPTLLDYYPQRVAQYEANVTNTQLAALSLVDQISSRERTLKLLETRKRNLSSRLDAISQLKDKGVATKKQHEEHADRLMNLTSQLNQASADLVSLRDQLRQTKLKAKQYGSDFRLELQKKRLNNELRLPELRRQALVLKDEIQNAVIRSPIAGSVMELDYATNQMQVPKGATVAVISRPLESPKVHVTIPSSLIDQVEIGMEGLLTLSSLPQRDLARITAQVTAISPDVSIDPNGEPLGYRAEAQINQAELEFALNGLALKPHLSSGMPIALALRGRDVTFSQYLVAPFFTIFQGALQD